MDVNTKPHTKADLLARIEREYAAFEQTIGQLEPAQLLQPVDGGWSVKDMIAHITAWEQIMLMMYIHGKPFHEVSRVYAVDYVTHSVDQLNDAFHERDKDLQLTDVLDQFRRSHQQLLATLETMSEAELLTPYTPPGRSKGAPLVDFVSGDSHEHYQEHREVIERIYPR